MTAQGVDANSNAIQGQDSEEVSITDVLPDMMLTKVANPTQILEPGGNVSFTVTITNNSLASTDPLQLQSLIDSIYGDLNGQGNCTLPQTLAVGSSYQCTFSTFLTGNAGDSETNTITGNAVDDEGNPISHSDSATVLILNVPSSISVTKTAAPLQVVEPGGLITYSYTVSNNSSIDSVTINTFTDDLLGDLNGQGTCMLPQALAPLGSYSCTFSAQVSGNANTAVTNVATATGIDDDGENVMAMDDATVNITNAVPAASLVKDVAQAVVTYQVSVSNDSDAESLTLTSLVDDQLGDITQIQGFIKSTTCVVPQVLQPATMPGDTYQCTFEALINQQPHTNIVTGTLQDDDGSPNIMPADGATIMWE